MNAWTIYESPLGPLTLRGGDRGLTNIDFPGHAGPLDDDALDSETLAEAVRQLEQYFAGERQAFELALDLGGTPFQRAVWEALARIPYGSTLSYTQLAAAAGRPDRVRAVGAAVGRTPVPIIVPCHRALGADGSLTGYRGGLHRKQALLDLEARSAAGHVVEPAWSFRQIALM
jgi:methylated-DNA-[protein]-cysteine S-methyltransferase